MTNLSKLKKASEHGIQAPLALLAELSHRCPLQCPYCSNPVQLEKKTGELTTDEWKSVPQPFEARCPSMTAYRRA